MGLAPNQHKLRTFENGFNPAKSEGVAPKMPHCEAYKNDFLRCGARVHAEGDMCGTHRNTHARRVLISGERPAGTCAAYLTTHRWCGEATLPGDRLCQLHAETREHSEMRQLQNQQDRETLMQLRAEQPTPTWQAVMDRMFNDETRSLTRAHQIAWRYFAIFTNVVQEAFHDRWEWLIDGRVGPEPFTVPIVVVPPPPAPLPQPVAEVGELARFAADAQNVHTSAVNKQTNAGLEKLLAVAVPHDQDTQLTMSAAWFKLPSFNFTDYVTVINDVNKWFNRKTCRKDNDKLYRNALRGLVAIINRKPEELRKELFQRLWEECNDAVDMCCDGHITRLCNVLVGFDDAFKPPVSIGELLQNAMAAIAAAEISDVEKLNRATAFFDEHGIPQEERVAWLEAM